MNNVLYTNFPVHLRYDLKGSWVDRVTGKQYDENPRKTVGKDLDLADQFVNLSPENRAKVLDILRRDSEFLARMNIMDYSLLLGIHVKDVQDLLPMENNPGSFSRWDFHEISESHLLGCFEGVETRCVMGIIDILQQYTLRKKVERYIKTRILRMDKDGVSVTKPVHYASRFLLKMETVFISVNTLEEEAELSARSIGSIAAKSEKRVFIEKYKKYLQTIRESRAKISNETTNENSVKKGNRNSFEIMRDKEKRISALSESMMKK